MFELEKCNKMGYLVSSADYDETDYLAIINNPDTEYVTVTETGEESFSINWSGNFVFNRTSPSEKLYLIWDYTDRNPVLSGDSANTTIGGSVVVDVLDNDEVSVDAIVEIAVQPLHGTTIVNLDKTITYTHDGSGNYDDSFVYMVTDNGCKATANVLIGIGAPCGSNVAAGGGSGVYEAVINVGTDIGWFGLEYNAQGVPDRFILYWGDTKVADSKYVGDGLNLNIPIGYPSL